MSVNQLIDPISGGDGAITLPHGERWMQGRTFFGGASALIAYTHAMRSFPDLPPLRAGQIGFVAPVGPEMELRSEIIRQGRNVAQLRSEILCEGKVALTAFWLFGTARETNALHAAPPPAPGAGEPEACVPADTKNAPEFLKNNFEVRRIAQRDDDHAPVIRRWARLSQPTDLDPVAELILLGDTMPASALRIMQRPGPVSSINWSFNLLDTEPRTRDGWWLVETASDHAENGYSSERLKMWNAEGKQMTSGLQSVAIFG